MTEQQYRVVADRATDDVYGVKREPGDRVTYGPLGHDIVRIDRPVPTEPCLSTAHHMAHEWGNHDGQPGTGFWCPGFDATDERPAPTTGDMTAMSHETTGFCFCGQMHGRVAEWSEADWDCLARIWREMEDEGQARRQVAEEAQRG